MNKINKEDYDLIILITYGVMCIVAFIVILVFLTNTINWFMIKLIIIDIAIYTGLLYFKEKYKPKET